MTEQVPVANERLGRIGRLYYHIMEGLLTGSLDPAEVEAGFRQIYKGQAPKGDTTSAAARKCWVSLRNARNCGEPQGYSRQAIGRMYGLLASCVTRGPSGSERTPWPVEYRGGPDPLSMEFELKSLVQYARTGAEMGTGWGSTMRDLFYSWIDELKEEL